MAFRNINLLDPRLRSPSNILDLQPLGLLGRQQALRVSSISVEDIRDILIPFLDAHPEITGLSLKGLVLGDKVVSEVARDLLSLKLTYLSLEENSINDKGAVAIALALETNSTLIDLNLESNFIWDKGAIALAKVLTTNQGIKLASLQLGWNWIGPTGIKALAFTYLHQKHNYFAFYRRNTPWLMSDERRVEEERLNEDIKKALVEKNPIKILNGAREAGISTGMPSLKEIMLFKVKEGIATKSISIHKELPSELKEELKVRNK